MAKNVLIAHDQPITDEEVEALLTDLATSYPNEPCFILMHVSYEDCVAVALETKPDLIAVLAFDDSQRTAELFSGLAACPGTQTIPSELFAYPIDYGTDDEDDGQDLIPSHLAKFSQFIIN